MKFESTNVNFQENSKKWLSMNAFEQKKYVDMYNDDLVRYKLYYEKEIYQRLHNLNDKQFDELYEFVFNNHHYKKLNGQELQLLLQNTKLHFGKHCDKSLYFIQQHHTKYFEWLLKNFNPNATRRDRSFFDKITLIKKLMFHNNKYDET